MTGVTQSASVSREVTPEDQARADLYHLLGALLARPPDADLLEVLGRIEPTSAQEGDLPEAWRELSDAARGATAGQVEDEYHALFIGLGKGELSPYASVYFTGFLMEKPLADLRAHLAQLGIQRRADVREPEDHAGALMEVMGMIILENGLPLDDIHGFFREYIESWLERFFQDLQAASNARFYRAVGRLGRGFMEVETRWFSIPS